jgi:hypothetical protein
MSGVTLKINSSDMAIAKRLLRKLPKKMKGRISKDALTKGTSVYVEKFLKPALDKRDHTLSHLAALGHPYARKHGSIQIHSKNPWVVHRRTGALYNSIRSEIKTSFTGHSVRVYPDLGAAPHIRYVFSGTRNMLPRDPFTGVKKKAKADIEFAVINHIMDEMDKL